MTVAQAQFTAAMLDARAPVPEGLCDPAGRPAGRRFSVYRNNMAVSLTEALRQGFPVLRALVGDAFFTAMAGVFLRAHPPADPRMMHYGAAMPGFLAGFAPVAHLPYLPDIARLELALRASYHAADARPADPAPLAALPPEALMQVRLGLAPALRLVRSAHPVASIWAAHQPGGPARPGTGPEDALITRPGFDPVVTALPAGGGGFIVALLAGASLGEAHEAAETDGHNFNLLAALQTLLEGQAIVQIRVEKQP